MTNFRNEVLRQRMDIYWTQLQKASAIDFAADENKCQSLREEAHAIGDTNLELYAINLKALLYLVTQKLDQALDTYIEGERLSKLWGDREREVVFETNIGTIHARRKNYSAARSAFESAWITAQTLPETPDNVTRIYTAYLNLAGVAMAMDDAEGTERYAQNFLNEWDTPRFRLVKVERIPEFACNVRNMLSWAYCAQGKYAEAKVQAELLLEAAAHANYLVHSVEGYLNLLRVTVLNPTTGDPEEHWQRLNALIAKHLIERNPLLPHTTEALHGEAERYRKTNHLLWAQRCDEKANEIMATARPE